MWVRLGQDEPGQDDHDFGQRMMNLQEERNELAVCVNAWRDLVADMVGVCLGFVVGYGDGENGKGI